jgi:hypothetical protein
MNRMKQSANQVSKRMMLFIAILLVIIGNLALVWEAMQAASLTSSLKLQTATPYPTDYPPEWQTVEALQRQTQQAAALTPIPTGTARWSIPPITSAPVPTEPYPVTPAGDGAIIDPDEDPALSKLIVVTILSSWYTDVGGKHITVFAGSDYNDDAQGMVYVTIDGYPLPDGSYFPTPHRSGAVRIVGAQGQRLILLSIGGETFYFDVPGLQFTDSLSANVPTVTPRPITPTPSLTPTLIGDAPHNPDDVPGLSPVNTPLHFILSRSGDEHWFRFRLSTPGTIQVHLDNLPANYDLYVYSGSYVGYGGQSTNSGITSELVVIQNAPVDDYWVRVVGVKGAVDPVHPYRLEFAIPAMPPTAISRPRAVLLMFS